MNDLYHQQILELYKNPDHAGIIDDPTHTHTEGNASCGDEFTFYLKVGEDQVIEEISFEGQGCAISTASASLLADHLKGKEVGDIKNLDQSFMEELIGVADISAGRIKCLTLPLKAIKNIVSSSQ